MILCSVLNDIQCILKKKYTYHSTWCISIFLRNKLFTNQSVVNHIHHLQFEIEADDIKMFVRPDRKEYLIFKTLYTNVIFKNIGMLFCNVYLIMTYHVIIFPFEIFNLRHKFIQV